MFLEGFLIIAMVFGFCFGIAILIRLGVAWSCYCKEQKAITKGPKIYYIKEISTPTKRRKRKKRKSPEVALKGVILSPEQFKVIERDIK